MFHQAFKLPQVLQPIADMAGVSCQHPNAELDYAPHAGYTNWRYRFDSQRV